jgi:hypothetical protein
MDVGILTYPDPFVSTGMVREFPLADKMGRFIGSSGVLFLLCAAMLPVHYDLFLYDMRERHNRLFLREFNI